MAQGTNEAEKQWEDDNPNAVPGQPRHPCPKTPMFPNEPQDTLLLCGVRDMTPIREKTSAKISRQKKEPPNQNEPASENVQVNPTHGSGNEQVKSGQANAED